MQLFFISGNYLLVYLYTLHIIDASKQETNRRNKMTKFTTKQKEAVSKKINALAEQVMSKEMFIGFLTGDLIMRTLFLGTTAELSGNEKVNKFCQECLEKM